MACSFKNAGFTDDQVDVLVDGWRKVAASTGETEFVGASADGLAIGCKTAGFSNQQTKALVEVWRKVAVYRANNRIERRGLGGRLIGHAQ